MTAPHSLLIDGVLVPAEALINGATITRYARRGRRDGIFPHQARKPSTWCTRKELQLRRCSTSISSFVNFAEYLRRYGMPTATKTPCPPVIPVLGGRDEFKSRVRSALSPWIDLSDQAEVVRDRLEERALVAGSSEPGQ